MQLQFLFNVKLRQETQNVCKAEFTLIHILIVHILVYLLIYTFNI